MTDLPDFLVTYLEQRQNARTEAIAAILNSLTDRERALVHDAAVMGYVRGSMAPKGEDIPLNADIVAEVIDACRVFPKLYPAVNADFEDHRQTIEYFIQSQQPDGTWEQCSSTSTDLKFAVERLAARRRMQPELECRLVRRTTTVVIEAALEQPEEDA